MPSLLVINCFECDDASLLLRSEYIWPCFMHQLEFLHLELYQFMDLTWRQRIASIAYPFFFSLRGGGTEDSSAIIGDDLSLHSLVLGQSVMPTPKFKQIPTIIQMRRRRAQETKLSHLEPHHHQTRTSSVKRKSK